MTDSRRFKAPYNANERIWQEADRLRTVDPAARSGCFLLHLFQAVPPFLRHTVAYGLPGHASPWSVFCQRLQIATPSLEPIRHIELLVQSAECLRTELLVVFI